MLYAWAAARKVIVYCRLPRHRFRATLSDSRKYISRSNHFRRPPWLSGLHCMAPCLRSRVRSPAGSMEKPIFLYCLGVYVSVFVSDFHTTRVLVTSFLFVELCNIYYYYSHCCARGFTEKANVLRHASFIAMFSFIVSKRYFSYYCNSSIFQV